MQIDATWMIAITGILTFTVGLGAVAVKWVERIEKRDSLHAQRQEQFQFDLEELKRERADTQRDVNALGAKVDVMANDIKWIRQSLESRHP